MSQCYMCESESITTEHVPPRCLFPEKKDIDEDVDFRKNLITVPSCKIHNSGKSNDDEYLLYCLSCTITSNDIAIQQFNTKVKRAIERNSNLMQQLMINRQPVLIQDQQTGTVSPSFGMFVDRERLRNIFEHIGYGLYRHIKKVRWEKEIIVHSEFLIHLQEVNSQELNDEMAEISNMLNESFNYLPFYGDNPRIFKYKYYDQGNDFIIRMYFYGDSMVTLMFGNKPLN